MSDPGCPRCGSSFGGARLDGDEGVELCPQCAPYPETDPDVRTDRAAMPEPPVAAGTETRVETGAETVFIARSRVREVAAASSATIVAKTEAPAPAATPFTTRAFLKWESAPDGEGPIQLAPGSTFVGSDGVTLRVADSELVPYHFRIEARGNEFFLHDSAGTSGTFLNGYRIRAVKLMGGDRITAGSATFAFSVR